MSKATTRPNTGSHRIAEALGALRHRNYRLYWFGQLSSVLAQNMEGIAQSWLVLELTNSPLLLGLTGLAFARRGHCRLRRPKTHNDFLPTWFGFHLLYSRQSRDRWMDRIVAGNDVGLSIGVHQSLRPAEPYGLASTDGA
jgi:hypothetical protein